MRKQICLITAVFLLLLLIFPVLPISAAPDGEAIRSEEDFYSMKPGGSYYLDCDLLLTKTYSQSFSGSLDGNGHTITTVAIGSVFKKLDNATVKNIKLSSAYSSSASKTFGALAESGSGRFDDVSAAVKLEISKAAESYSGALGGLIGEVIGETAFENCTVNGYLKISTSPVYGTGIETSVGGIVGRAVNAGEVSFISCISNASVESLQIQMSVGGILGCASKGSQVVFVDCQSTGKISGVGGTHSGVGGLCGTADGTHSPEASMRFEGCLNKAAVSETERREGGGNLHIGGMLGRGYGIALLEFDSCINMGEVYSRGGGWASAGGLAGGVMTYGFAWSGTHGGLFSVNNCANTGSISGGAFCGGLVGGALQFNTNDCEVRVTLSANYGGVCGESAGGIIGHCGESGFNGLLVSECYNSGSIDGGNSSAGIVGSVNTASDGSEYAITKEKERRIEGCINSGAILNSNTGSAGIISAVTQQSVTVRECINLYAGEGEFAAISQADGKNIYAISNSYVGQFGGHAYATTISESNAAKKETALRTELPADTLELQRWLDAVDGYTSDGYSAGWSAFADERERARGCAYSLCSYEEAAEREKALLAALEGLVIKDGIDNSPLLLALEEAEKILGESERYTLQSWENFIKAYEKATYRRYSADNSEINETSEALLSALSWLGVRSDLEDLREALKRYAGYRPEEFTAYGWEEFREAFDAAAELNDSETVSTSEAEEAVIRLIKAAEALTPRSDANDLIKELQSRLEAYPREDYTASSYDSFESFLNELIALASTNDLSEEMLSEIEEEGRLATQKLVRRGNLRLLDPLLEKALFCKEDDYIHSAWKELVGVLEEIELSRSPENAADLSEEDVSALRERLIAAMENTKETEDSADEPKPAEPEKAKGCGGAISGAAVITVITCLALLSKRKKEN